MDELKDILYWRQSLGLLPIHLFRGKHHDVKEDFIMLDGGTGDFCLQTEIYDKSPEEYFSNSWSSNTKNYVAVKEDKVEVYNWEKNKPEVIAAQQVEDNFGKFYEYLISNSYKTESDLVPFVVDIFKEFRNITQEKGNALEALNLLFLLLITLEEDISSINHQKWGITQVSIPDGFGRYVKKLGDGISNINPELNLIMRHSAGVLFQEAQKEVLFFDRQMDIWGNRSSKYNSKKLLYSSIHYTPPYLARIIVENALEELKIDERDSLKIFDPACGSSEFLMESLKQLKERGYSGSIEIIGWDSSPTAIHTSNFLLSYEKNNVWEEQLNFEVNRVEDSLREEWDSDYDLILMNPPFVSWEQMNKKSRDTVRDILGSLKQGRPNQASAFLYKSVKCLGPNGAIGCVIPSSFLRLDAYDKLRDELIERMNLKLVGKLGNFIFEDALTDVSIIAGGKSDTNESPYVLWTKNERGLAQKALRSFRKMKYSGLNTVIESGFNVYKPLKFPVTEENWKPISYQENELIKKIERLSSSGKISRVKEVFNVRQGIRTGKKSVFKIDSFQFNDLPEEEKKFFRPAVDNDAIKNGKLLKKKYVWYPYDENGIKISSEEELREAVPMFYSILEESKQELIDRARINENNWWHLSEHRAWLRKKEPRLVSTEFGKSDSFAFDEKGEFVIQRGNAFVPKKQFESKDDFYFYLAIFSSSTFENFLGIYSKEILSGWYLGNKYTKNIPIPNVHFSDVKESNSYDKLVSLGREISSGDRYSSIMIDEILKKYIYPFENM